MISLHSFYNNFVDLSFVLFSFVNGRLPNELAVLESSKIASVCMPLMEPPDLDL